MWSRVSSTIRLGNFYVAAIEGVPGGIDVWKSSDGGASFSYLGQPDGVQIGSALAGVDGVGLGGGDEDLAVSPAGRCLCKFSMVRFGHTEHVIQWRNGLGIEPRLQRFAAG